MEIPQRTLGIEYCHNLFYGHYLFDVPSFGDGPDLRFFFLLEENMRDSVTQKKLFIWGGAF